MATYRIAVGTLDGKEITEHFGQSKGFRIIEVDQSSDEEKPIADIADELECTTRQVSRYYRSGLIDFEEKYGEFYKNVV